MTTGSTGDRSDRGPATQTATPLAGVINGSAADCDTPQHPAHTLEQLSDTINAKYGGSGRDLLRGAA